MWLPLDTVFAGNACCLEKGDGSALKQLLSLECNKILKYTYSSQSKHVKGGGPPPKPCRYIWALDSDIDFTGVSWSGGPHWNRAQKSWALIFFLGVPGFFRCRNCRFFPSKPSKKLRIINKIIREDKLPATRGFFHSQGRDGSFPPGADLITLFSLARSSGSLIVGPTFAGRGEGSFIPDEWRWPGMAGKCWKWLKKYCKFSCLWGVNHS